MRSLQDLEEKLMPYAGPKVIYREDFGYIVWQESTGNNVEILFIEVKEPGRGHATELVKHMCEFIKPYNSVFVFRLASNERAGGFYRKLGFQETPIEGLYTAPAVLGVVSYKDLCHYLSTQ